jgi:hypothetical protein
MKFFEEEEINRKNYTKMSKKEQKPKKINSHRTTMKYNSKKIVPYSPSNSIYISNHLPLLETLPNNQ